jgi:uncharacterized protein YqhQ
MSGGSGEEAQSLAFGGQALIEGVMMRSGSHTVMCVRQPDSNLTVQIMEYTSYTRRYPLLFLPFLRGVVAFAEMTYLGMKSIFYSANVSLGEEEEFTWKEYVLVGVMVLAMSAGFMVIPFMLANYFGLTSWLLNAAEALIRLSLFLGYMGLISTWGEFRRVLMYHGAEHKTINAHEAGKPLTVESVRGLSRLNPRCGTSFLFIVLVVSVALFSLLTAPDFYTRIAYRVFLIPVIGSVSYELLKLSDKYRGSAVMGVLMAPGLLFQRLTTREPDDSMIKVAIRTVEEIKRLGAANAAPPPPHSNDRALASFDFN